MAWEDDDFDISKGFTKNEEANNIFEAPKTTNITQQRVDQKEIELKNAMKDMEEFLNDGLKEEDQTKVKSKFGASPTIITSVDLKDELKASIKEAQTIDDYLRISQQIVSIITIAKDSEYYTKFLTSIIRDCTSGMSAEDIKSITANMSAKAAKKAKKQKPALKVQKERSNIDNIYDNYDDIYGDYQDDFFN